jgi:DNA-binding NtrC family response regulator
MPGEIRPFWRKFLIILKTCSLGENVKTILIVDDDADSRLLCERALQFKGYVTRSLSSGKEALEYLLENPEVKLMVLDIKMSPLTGIQVLEEIRTRKIDIPVILYSDYPLYKSDFKTWLADAFIVKSSDTTELKKTVGEFLVSPKKNKR